MFKKKPDPATLERQVAAYFTEAGVPQEAIQSIHIENGVMTAVLACDPDQAKGLESFCKKAESEIAGFPGLKKASVILTAERSKAAEPDPHGMSKNPPLELPVRRIIAVASGKGGVGKSTVALNLAIALAYAGQSVGLLDADIYGPSVPRMTGLEGKKPHENLKGKIAPLEAHGLKVMSIGFMIENEAPLVWRGPMVQSALYQMLRDVAWGTDEKPLDILIVDMPPGTGDAHLTLAQKVPVAGVVIVSTPQDIALIDARKAYTMFEKVGVPVLGLIENMSRYACPSCGHEDHVFGHGGAKAEAEKLGCTFLGEIPLNASIRAESDAGQPATGDAARIFQSIAAAILRK